ncbi:MAG: 50S ribosomal protein L11 methyltransferase [Anderseniella sp.]
MSRQFVLTSPPQARQAADNLSDVLQDCPWPEALAVSMVETDEAQDLWQVEAIYADKPDIAGIEAAIERAGLASGGLEIIAMPHKDWVRESLAGLAPVVAGRLFVHGNHDRHLRRSGSINIEIDAGLAFGTGHHNTTRGCLVALQAVLKSYPPKNCLDVGCGSGVLAIAACRLAGITAVASDMDEDAVTVARQNAELNGTAHLMRCITATGLDHPAIAAKAPYDLILANILARPLISLAPAIARALSTNGRLILSGLTDDQVRMVRAAYLAQGLSVVDAIVDDNWATLTLARKQRGMA